MESGIKKGGLPSSTAKSKRLVPENYVKAKRKGDPLNILVTEGNGFFLLIAMLTNLKAFLFNFLSLNAVLRKAFKIKTTQIGNSKHDKKRKL